jgi:hypothetical protein
VGPVEPPATRPDTGPLSYPGPKIQVQKPATTLASQPCRVLNWALVCRTSRPCRDLGVRWVCGFGSSWAMRTPNKKRAFW